MITLGDEFQGLLFAEKGADPIFVADRIIDEMFPVRIRIAIGFGGIATQIRREAAIGADGEAFYRARHGMNLLRKAENRGRACSRILLDAGECSDCDRNARRKELETGVNTVLLLLSALRRERTKRQNEAAAMYVRNAVTNAAQTQTELAKRLGITQSTFNISLSVSNAREYAEGLIAAEALLSELKTDGEHAENGDKECADKTVLT